MGRRTTFGLVASVAVLLLSGCGSMQSQSPYINNQDPMTLFKVPADVNIAQTSYVAAEQLVNQTDLSADAPVLVASLANVNDVRNSSALGRIIAEQVSSRLAQLGYAVSEVKLRSSMAINENGEFMLSRDVRALGAAQNAQAVVAGTYAAGTKEVYVSLRLIRLSDSRVLGGVDYALPAGPNTQSLVKTATYP
jgi:TolB-like protein